MNKNFFIINYYNLLNKIKYNLMDINPGKENKIKLKLINELIIKFHQFFVEKFKSNI